MKEAVDARGGVRGAGVERAARACTCTATSCAGSAASTKRSRDSKPPTSCSATTWRAKRSPPEFDWHHAHNLDLLAASYQYIGQMRKAEALLKQSFNLPTNLLVQVVNKREWPAFLLARNRPAEALAAAKMLHRASASGRAGNRSHRGGLRAARDEPVCRRRDTRRTRR